MADLLMHQPSPAKNTVWRRLFVRLAGPRVAVEKASAARHESGGAARV